MELKTTKEFVLKAHKEASSKLKIEIEKEFPEAFKLELNRWYKWNGYNPIMGFVDRVSRATEYYCFKYTQNGDCEGNYDSLHYSLLHLATFEEIEAMLWQEAEKRGIGKDTKIDVCLCSGEGAYNDRQFGIAYSIERDELWNKNGCIYKQGKWTTPLDPNKELKEQIETMEKELQKLKERIK